MDKNKIKQIFKELQGYLSQTPIPKDTNEVFYDNSQWDFLNVAIDRLNSISENNYDAFKIIQRTGSDGYKANIRVSEYRAKLGGLINRLHEEYFSDEPTPFSGSGAPSTIITNMNSQQQSQTQQQTMDFNQMLQQAQKAIAAEYGDKESTRAIDLIKKIIANPGNWAIIASAVSGLLAIGKVAFVAAIPILTKIFTGL